MHFTRKRKILLLIALILLNLVIRVPTFPHEGGPSDSFQYHANAKSISVKGFADWAINPMGLFGNYGESKFAGTESIELGSGEPSSFQFFLSGFYLLTNIDMEIAILVSGIVIGTLGALFSFALAKQIIDDDLFGFVAGFAFSFAPLFILYGIWTAAPRQLFMILLLIFLIVLFKFLTQIEFRKKIKYLVIILILLILLFATHRLSMFVFIVFAAYFFVILQEKLNIQLHIKNQPIKILFPWIILVMILLFLQIFKLGFFEKFPISEGYASGFLMQGTEWYVLLFNMIIDYASNIGVLMIFSLIGLFFLLKKMNKNRIELLLIFILLIFASISSYGKYSPLFILPFSSLLIGIGFINVKRIIPQRTFSYILSVVLLASIVFSMFMLWHWQYLAPPKESEKYMREDTFNTILFINSYNKNNYSMTNSYERQFYANLDRSIPSIYHSPIIEYNYDSFQFQQQLNKSNINYYIEKNSISGSVRQFSGELVKINSFLYIVNNKNKIYNNGDLSVYYLEYYK